MGKTLTVSALPTITFYTGEYSENAANAIENRDYGYYIPELGYLSQSFEYNSYWSNKDKKTDTLFVETPVKYNNIGDIIKSTVSYMNKFKNNQIEINVDTNVIEFNFDYEKDLNSEFNNTYIIPSSQLYSLLVNCNEMTFNKQYYYRKQNEINDVTFAHKNFPYNQPGTIFIVDDEENPGNQINYDFSNKYVNYNYNVQAYDYPAIDYVYDLEGNLIPGSAYEITLIGYSYFVKNIDYLKPRFNKYFNDNSNNLISNIPSGDKQDIAYSISDLNTVVNLTLNTLSLGRKNLLAYINFTSKYNDWYNKTIQFETAENLVAYDKISITPANENYFDVVINKEKIFTQDIESNGKITFTLSNPRVNDIEIFDILNPENIKEIDLSYISHKISKVNLLHKYDKKINANETILSSWINETDDLLLESLNVGSNNESNITDINGITHFKNLKTINITNCNQLFKEFSLHKLTNLKNFYAAGSARKTFIPAREQRFENVSLPNAYLNTLILRDNTIQNFDYIPNANLVNLTFENTTINKDKYDQNFLLQEFVNTWLNSLKTSYIQTKTPDDGTSKIKVLYSGLINNTILSGINFTDYPISYMIDLSYIGLNMNKLSGTINISGTNSGKYLKREEYMQLRNIYGDDLMHVGKTNDEIQNDKFKLLYNIDENIFKKRYSITIKDQNDNDYIGEGANYLNISTDPNINNINISTKKDNKIIEYYSGHSLFDYIKNGHNKLEFTEKDIEKLGMKLTLKDTNIIPDLSKEELIDKSLSSKIYPGDILLYQGNTIILVLKKNKPTIYNYIKLGRFNFIDNLNDHEYNNIKSITLNFNNNDNN